MSNNVLSDGKNIDLHADGAEAFEFIEDTTPFFSGKTLTLIEVGAHLGNVFKALSSSKLYIRHSQLIEANSDTYKDLVRSAKAQKRGRYVNYHNVAFGEKPGFVQMQSEGGMSHVIKHSDKSANQGSSKESFQIEVVPMDLLVEREAVKRVHLLKIDVEGFELEILSGARGLLEKNLVDVIYIEAGFSSDGGQQAYDRPIEDYIMQFGYKIFRIYEQKNEWPEDSAALRRANFAFMSQSFLSENPYKVTMKLFEARRELDAIRRQEKSLIRSIFEKIFRLKPILLKSFC